MDQGTERAVGYFVMDAVAGARTLWRHKTGGVPPKPPATFLLSGARGVLGLQLMVRKAELVPQLLRHSISARTLGRP